MMHTKRKKVHLKGSEAMQWKNVVRRFFSKFKKTGG